MFTHTLSRFEQNVITIHPGEYFASTDDVIISTLLGSCVSVAFWDRHLKMGGLNHFMLPDDLENNDMTRSQSAKYGMYAIELLYNELFKAGSKKRDLVAKVFGGASVLMPRSASAKIPKDNIAFALAYLQKENIPIIANDTGGILPRRIYLFAQSGKVLLKRIVGPMAGSVERAELEYLDRIRRADARDATLF
ncbi:hypothetical protein MASR2M48_23040 [Spirochaetota bacterium]